MSIFQTLQKELDNLADMRTKRSLYPILNPFFQNFASEFLGSNSNWQIITEGSSKNNKPTLDFQI